MPDRIIVGRLAGAFGVKGEVRLKSFCAEPGDIAGYAPLHTPDGRAFPRLRLTGMAAGALTARVEGIATREEAEARSMSTRLILGQSVRLEVDRDGRIVMPAPRRAKLGLTEGEVVFSGAGDHFEIWAAATYDEKVGARMRAFLAAQPEGFDPMTLVWSMGT